MHPLFYSLRWPIYYFNSVVNTKIPANSNIPVFTEYTLLWHLICRLIMIAAESLSKNEDWVVKPSFDGKCKLLRAISETKTSPTDTSAN